METCWKLAGNQLKNCWAPAGNLLETCWLPAGNLLYTCWKPAGHLLESCLALAGSQLEINLGVCWKHVGNLLDTCWKLAGGLLLQEYTHVSGQVTSWFGTTSEDFGKHCADKATWCHIRPLWVSQCFWVPYEVCWKPAGDLQET